MKTILLVRLIGLLPLFIHPPLAQANSSSGPGVLSPDGWSPVSLREEIRPAFRSEPTSGRNGGSVLVIEHDSRPGLDGFWMKRFPVIGGRFYRFEAFRRTHDVDSPRRSGMVRILWQDAAGKKVVRDEATTRQDENHSSAHTRYVTDVLPGFNPTAEAEHPLDKDTDSNGWTEVSDVYKCPRRRLRRLSNCICNGHLEAKRMERCVAWRNGATQGRERCVWPQFIFALRMARPRPAIVRCLPR